MRRTLLALALLPLSVNAQVSRGGVPPSALTDLPAGVPTERIPAVDLADLNQMRLEDSQRTSSDPFRFAALREVELGLADGRWTALPGGDRVWRLRVESPGAYSLMLTFERFQLSEGGALYVYDDARRYVRGAFTHENNRLDGTFAISPTPGDALTLEYFEPAGTALRGELELAGVLHDYVDILQKGGGNGNSAACEVDVACPEGAGWEDQSRSVVMVFGQFGTCCSGVLLNNTLGDGTPYLLTAEHCGNLNAATFQFNWKRPACGSGDPTSLFDTLQSSMRVASDGVLDYQLLRLSRQPPTSYAPFYAGWDRSDLQPDSAVGIHHPRGDVMKISIENNKPRFSGDLWKIRIWDQGATEPGSSGSPLFDPNGRALGQLIGGAASCDDPVDDFYGRLALQWSGLGRYLDPVGSGLLVFDGLDPVSPAGFSVIGVVPAVAPALLPGTEQTMRLVGDGFTAASTLALDGVPLPSTSYTLVTTGRIDFDLPPVGLGTHTLTVTEGSLVEDATLVVFDTQQPIHQAGSGDAGNAVLQASGIPLVNADTPGHTNVTLWSLSPSPSVHPLITLSLGNGFTEIMRANLVTIPAEGYSNDLCAISPGLVGQTVYSQSFCAQCPFPASGTIPISNLQSVVVQ